MSHRILTAPVSAANADALWHEIDEAAHEGCILRCSGRLREAKQIMEHTLPLIIRDWAKVCGLPTDARKDRLRELFAQVQERVAQAVVSRRLEEAALPPDERRRRHLGRPLQLSRHIAIDDVAGMLDAMHDLERRWNPAPRLVPMTARTQSGFRQSVRPLSSSFTPSTI